MGHAYKVLAYLMLYWSMFVETVTAPYRALNASRREIQAMVEAIPDLLLEVDQQGRLLRLYNPEASRSCGLSAEAVGRSLEELLPEAEARGCLVALGEALHRASSTGWQLNLQLEGQPRSLESSVSPLSLRQAVRYVVLARDISERLRDQQRIERLAHYDTLTGLPNRA